MITCPSKNWQNGPKGIKGNFIRNWGYAQYYKPKIEKSMKHRLYNELGPNYKFARPHENKEVSANPDWIGQFKLDNEYDP